MREVGRFVDVYQAEVAAGFLVAHGIPAVVAERITATMNPWLQTAIGGVRVLAPVEDTGVARELLARAGQGEFVADAEPGAEGPADEVEPRRRGGTAFAAVTALSGILMGGGYAGRPYPGRFAAVQRVGLILLAGLLLGWAALIASDLLAGEG